MVDNHIKRSSRSHPVTGVLHIVGFNARRVQNYMSIWIDSQSTCWPIQNPKGQDPDVSQFNNKLSYELIVFNWSCVNMYPDARFQMSEVTLKSR